MSTSMDRRTKIYVTLALCLMLALLIGITIANFTAQTTNGTNTFASGTLVLSNAKTAGTTCLSTNGGTTDVNNNSVGCDNLIGATVQKPGGPVVTNVVTLKNVGDITPTAFTLWTTSCTSSNAVGETYHGTGNVCTVTNLTLHDDTNNFCYYPVAAAGACVMTTGKNLSTFATAYPVGTPLALGLTGINTGIAYSLSTQMDASAGNTMQGLSANLDLNWKIVQ